MPRIIFIFLLITILLAGCDNSSSNGTENAVVTDNGVVGEKEPITRAQVAKMLALSIYSQDEIDNMERVIAFTDTDTSKWYDKYINAAYNANLISGVTDISFMPDKELTLVQAKVLVRELNKNNNFELKYNESDKDKPISYKTWLEAFTKAVGNKITLCNIFVYATGNQCKELGEKYVLCNGGLRTADGIDMTPYEDKILYVAMKGTEILGIIKISDFEPVLKKSEVIDISRHSITIKLSEAERKFKVDNNEQSFKIGDSVDVAFNKQGEYKITLSKE